MKKLIIAAAIVCAAAFANAATASWYVGFINDLDGNALSAESTGYTAILNVYTDSALTDLVTSSSVSEWDEGLAVGETDDVLSNTSDTTYYAQVILQYGENSSKSDGFQFTTSTLSDVSELFIMNDTSSIIGIEKIGGGEFDGEFGAFESSKGGVWSGSVPEPTSGLLILVGAAALALRRKQA